jgi:hypothetical protein
MTCLHHFYGESVGRYSAPFPRRFSNVEKVSGLLPVKEAFQG